MDQPIQHTKVIFTIGPATYGEDVLRQIIQAGASICRINMAHANHEWTRDVVRRVRKVCEAIGQEVAILMDVKGPEIRTGAVPAPLKLTRDGLLDLYLQPDRPAGTGPDGVPGVSVNYPGLGNDVRVGDTILVDSGLLRLRVEEVTAERIRTSVRIGGEMGSRRHINLPGVKVNLPCLTDKDKDDIRVGIEVGVDVFALSFVREPNDLEVMRRYITAHGSDAPIIAKMEDQTAVTNLEEIIRASDGLMVARGDLGIEVPYETLPVIQRRAVSACLRLGKPVIVATHMLESMIENPLPTRAEITDVANAVREQADCVMLSGETSTGKYPVECVETLNRIAQATESQHGPAYNSDLVLRTAREMLLRAAVTLSYEMPRAAIIVFTRRGYLTRVISSLRPRRSPIYAFPDDKRVLRRLLLLWGIQPLLIQFSDNPRDTLHTAIQTLKNRGCTAPGTRLIAVTPFFTGDSYIDTIQLWDVE